MLTSTEFASPDSAASDSAAPGLAPGRLLVVDDDASICAAYGEILRGQGYDVATAGSRAEALQTLDTVDGELDVLVLDIGLPDADGAQLAQEIVARIGARPTLYVSGWTDDFWDLTDAPGRWLVMQKPISVVKLIAAVDYLAGRQTSRPGFE